MHLGCIGASGCEMEGRLGEWHDLYVMLGSSSSALIGLLFVAASLKLKEIVSHPFYSVRARIFSLHLLATLFMAAAILTPQSMGAVGIEILIVNICAMWLPLSFTYKVFFKNTANVDHAGYSAFLGLSYPFGYLVSMIGGVGLIQLSMWGLYLVTIGYLILIASAILNAWMLMESIGRSEQLKLSDEQD